MGYSWIFPLSFPLLIYVDSSHQRTLSSPSSCDFIIIMRLRFFFPKDLDINVQIQDMHYLAMGHQHSQFSPPVLPFSLPYKHVTLFSGVWWFNWMHID